MLNASRKIPTRPSDANELAKSIVDLATGNTEEKEDIGEVCAEYQDQTLRNLPCKRVQVDEIWSFCYSKQKNVPKEKKGKFDVGDIWTWTAICADTKLVPPWLVATRDAGSATEFITDLASRLASRVQLTSDGLKSYLTAVDDAFGWEVEHAMLIKIYSNTP